MTRGFQSEDPTRDFRGAGLLALQNLGKKQRPAYRVVTCCTCIRHIQLTDQPTMYSLLLRALPRQGATDLDHNERSRPR